MVRRAFLYFVNDYNYTQGWLAENVIENIETLSEYRGLEFVEALELESQVRVGNFIFLRTLRESIPSDGHSVPILAICNK